MKILDVVLFAPALFATQPAAPTVVESLESLAREAESHGAQAGISVRSLTRGEWVFRRKSDKPFAAASNTKLVTTAAALALLGPGYQFETRFLASSKIEQKTLEGPLWVVGGGDPCFSGRFFDGNALAPFERMAEECKRRGIDVIRGGIVLDDRFFDREWVSPHWPKDQLSLDYCAPISALSLNEGCLGIEVTPRVPGQRPSIRTTPLAFDGTILNEMETEAGRGDPKTDFRFTAEGHLRVRGSIRALSGSYLGRITVPVPPDFFGDAVRQALGRRGIAIEGPTVLVREGETWTSEFSPLYSHRSPMQNALFMANKESSNFFAEHLFKALGAVVEKNGSWEGGERAVRRYLRDSGISEKSLSLQDGCGLSRGNRLTPDLLVSILSQVYGGEHRDLFWKSLPASGVDGTLSKRLTEPSYRGRVVAKTGWIQGASALSGYVRSRAGETFAFSILVNYDGKTNNSVFKSIQDRICRVLVDSARTP